jgi:hypothetical protein
VVKDRRATPSVRTDLQAPGSRTMRVLSDHRGGHSEWTVNRQSATGDHPSRGPGPEASERSAGSFAGSDGIPAPSGRSAVWQRASFGTRRPAVRIRSTRPAARRQRDVAQMAARRLGEPEVASSSTAVSTREPDRFQCRRHLARQHDACRREAARRRRLVPPEHHHGMAERQGGGLQPRTARFDSGCRVQAPHAPFDYRKVTGLSSQQARVRIPHGAPTGVWSSW